MATDRAPDGGAGRTAERERQDRLRSRLWQLFLTELDEHSVRLHQGLDELADAQPEVPADTVAELFRSAHSLKGAAQAVGATAVGTVCHQLEEVLAAARDGQLPVGPELLGGLGAGIDVVAVAAARLREGVDLQPAEVQDAVRRLAAQAGAARSGPAGTPGAAPPSRIRPQPTGEPVTPRAVADAPVPGDPAPPVHSTPAARRPGSVRVDEAKLDALMALAGELSALAHRTDGVVSDLLRTGHGGSVDAQQARTSAATARALRTSTDAFTAAARRLRTVPVTDATTGLSRVVQDVCGQTGKQARLVVDVADVEVDRAAVASLNNALRHLVRNAVDHGIEPPAERRAAGRPAEGTVTVRAVLRADAVEVTVADDGRGVDLAAVAAQAGSGVGHSSGPGDGVDRALEALFQPGFSTAATVSAISGRGVGLDAVRTEMERLGGTVTLDSRPNAGTRVTLTLPLALSTMRAVLARVGDELLALPTSAIRSLVRVRSADVVSLGGGAAVVRDGVTVRVVRLADALGWASAAAPRAEEWPALLVRGSEGDALLTLDELLAEREVVVTANPPRLAGLPGLLGTVLLEDGTVALVLSPAACVRLGRHGAPVWQPPALAEAPPRRVLLAEDTFMTRELERSILEAAGYAVVEARDGAEAWRLLQEHEVDVVVSDVNMPQMDGIALCRAIRSAPRFGGLPVVLVTSLASDEDRRNGLEAGADAYVTKGGFGQEQLLEALEQLL